MREWRSAVHFEGLQTNAYVMEAMRASDLVVVPSHHRYPEGLPCVFYEAFATRTPVICSDHPMFRGIISEDAAMLVPEKRSDKFADAVIRILCSPDLYRRMSVATKDAWLRIQCPVLWDELIDHFLVGCSPFFGPLEMGGLSENLNTTTSTYLRS